MSSVRVLAWLAFGLCCAALAVALVISGEFGLAEVSTLVFVLISGGVGVLILSRLGNHAVGWLLLATATCFATGGLLVTLVEELSPGQLTPYAAMTGNWAFALGIGAATLLLLVFPTGAMPSPRWRPLLWVIVAGTLATLAGTLLDPASFEDFPIANPWALSGDAQLPTVLLDGGQALLLVGIVGGLLSIAVRFRRGSSTERRQLEWVLLAVCIAAVALGTVVALEVTTDGAFSDDVGNLAITGALALLPASMGLAIFRYRLYDIDRIISRTVTYGLVVGLLGIVVLVVVGGLALFLPSDDPFVVASVTLVIFALFNPLRRRVQHWVDLRFNRSRYDVSQVIDRFSEGLQVQVDPDTVVTGWLQVVSATMEPQSVGVWVKEG